VNTLFPQVHGIEQSFVWLSPRNLAQFAAIARQSTFFTSIFLPANSSLEADRCHAASDERHLGLICFLGVSQTALLEAGPGFQASERVCTSGFFVQVGEDVLDNHRVFNAGDDLHCPYAHRTWKAGHGDLGPQLRGCQWHPLDHRLQDQRSRRRGLDAFLDWEQKRYRGQLERYATVLGKLDSRPIRLGLYFPLLGEWREWDAG
jgi:hypothetical protein